MCLIRRTSFALRYRTSFFYFDLENYLFNKQYDLIADICINKWAN